jgi:hypothetical protein
MAFVDDPASAIQRRVARAADLREDRTTRIALPGLGGRPGGPTLLSLRRTGAHVVAWQDASGGQPARPLDAFVTAAGDVVVWLPIDADHAAGPASAWPADADADVDHLAPA